MKAKQQKTLITLFLLITTPLTLTAVKTFIEIRKHAGGSYANIFIGVNQINHLQPQSFWQNLAQGGEEPTDMIAPVVPQVAALKPQYIRIDHVFDFYQVYQGPNNFNFTQLDKVINTILATGAKPFLSLSYTPAIMTANLQNAAEPQDWNQWYQMVKTTARRYSVDQNISGIYYEVWNEPDLFGSWHYGRSPSYSTLYIQTAQAVRDGASGTDFKVGGPATTSFYPNWINSLLKTCQYHSLPLDFLSWHHYSPYPQDFVDQARQLSYILNDYPQFQHLEFIISEYGLTDQNHPDYNSRLAALHLLSTITTTRPYFDKIFTFEIVDGPQSHWGLLTHPLNGANPKPRYSALNFLNQLTGQQLLVDGNGSWVTALATVDGSTINTLLVNYDPKNQHQEQTPITFQGLTPGLWQVNQISLDGNLDQSTVQINQANYTFLINLQPNSATLLQLTPTTP